MSAKICAVTFDAFRRQAFRGSFSEAHDVLQECADVEFIHLEPCRGFELREYWHRRLAAKDISGTLARINPGLRKVRLKKDYDLFLFCCPVWLDAMFVNAIDGWRERCKTSVCWINELWANRIPEYKNWLLPSLTRFDHLFIGLSGSVDPVRQALGRSCHYLPAGVDVARFSPYPHTRVRAVDVYSIGRRSAGIHQSLLRLAAEEKIFYIYDTLQYADSVTPDFRQHRELYANIAKRSKFFLVAPAKVDVGDHTRGQIEVSIRYFEGAAAGAVMIGQAPDCESFRQLFDWPEAVIEIEPDGSNVAEVLRGLAADPVKLKQISRRNASEALLRYDWVYRWEQILAIAEIAPTPAMMIRKNRLQGLARMALNDDRAA
jgi:hypothetical protein